MLIGIDVGGTYTDGVLTDGTNILHSSKRPTDEKDLHTTLLTVLDDLLHAVPADVPLERIVLSTTLVTNLLATGRCARTALLLMPGYGLPHDAYQISSDTYFLEGAIDFRGREISPINETEVYDLAARLRQEGIKRAAVAGKFSNRNRSHEVAVQKILKKYYPDLMTIISSDLSNKLNFPRRAATAYFTAAVSAEWQQFAEQIEQAIRLRCPGVMLHILKADGGTMPLDISRLNPCETIFSGPAASTMGALALTMDKKNSLVVDIGGTTSDLALLIDGQPLHASRGARLLDHYTHIEAVSVSSIPIGGDSPINVSSDGISIGQHRLGPAACFGGSAPTVTDAFNYFLQLGAGDMDLSNQALETLTKLAGLSVQEICSQVIDQVIQLLSTATHDIFTRWEYEPAYRVWEVVNRTKFTLDRVIGIGAAAPAIVPMLAESLEAKAFVHKYSPVANALGAALVRPTLSVSVHIDTEQAVCSMEPGGTVEKRPELKRYGLEDARQLALSYLHELAADRQIDSYVGDSRFFMEEQFNMIRGWDRTGRIFDIGVQIAPGFIESCQGVMD